MRLRVPVPLLRRLRRRAQVVRELQHGAGDEHVHRGLRLTHVPGEAVDRGADVWL